MRNSPSITRRDLIKISMAAGGTMLIGLYVPMSLTEAAPIDEFSPNVWLKVTANGRYIFILDRVEMGQGVMTSLPMILGEELDVAPERFEIEHAPADRRYDNPNLGLQITGGSSSVHFSWQRLREAGAQARAIFVEAAARQWQVQSDQCTTDDGVVIHAASSRGASYGSLIIGAAGIKINDVKLTDPKNFKYIGKPISRLENRRKVTGTAGFGMDVHVDGMQIAYIIRPPTLGAKVKSFDANHAKDIKNVHGVYEISNGVAIVAASYWQAKKAAELVKIDWKEPAQTKNLSSEKIRGDYIEAAKQEGDKVRADGSFAEAFKSAVKKLDVVYEMPYLAHATMEPQNCTANVTENACEVWAPTQSPGLALTMAAKMSGVPEDKVKIHTTFLGGGFGRRLSQDYVGEAVEIAKKAKVPVKVVWSREQDMQHSMYRPNSYHVLKAGIDAAGKPTAWFHHIVCQSILAQVTPQWVPSTLPNWVPGFAKAGAAMLAGWTFSGYKVDDTSVEGAKDLPYDISNLQVNYSYVEQPVPIGFWRSVGHSHTGFVVESFIDEVAHLAGKDPYLFRKELLHKAPKNLEVLNLVAEKSGWAKPLPEGVFRGIAQHSSFRSYAASVAEVAVEGSKIKVRRILTVIQCGLAINPDIIKAQLESAAIFGLTAALKGEITFADGRVQQSNFHDYPILRMNESPQIETFIVPSTDVPTGVGEPGLPPIAPAVANAVFAATGKRLRSLPLRLV